MKLPWKVIFRLVLVLGLPGSVVGCPIPGTFTVFPIDPAEVGGIIGLGNQNPGGSHTLPANHMYITFPDSELSHTGLTPPNPAHPIVAPAGGTIFYLNHKIQPYGDQFAVWVKVSDTVVFLLDHLDSLAPALQAAIAAPPYAWISIDPSGMNQVMILATPGYPPGISILAGQPLGTTRAAQDPVTGEVRVHAWDFGVIDQTIVHPFDDTTPSHYPSFQNLAHSVLGITVDWPFLGNPFISAGRFPEYYLEPLRSMLTSRSVCVSPLHDLGN
ncbi:MAG TPA: hypothetical protein VEN81_07975, partial [Planctomycetota bacterium]|nr:hypothetical protein [Planctomycetota bacterium]